MLANLEEIMKSKRLQSRRQTPVAADLCHSSLVLSTCSQCWLSLPQRHIKTAFESLANGDILLVWRPLPSDEAAEIKLSRQLTSSQGHDVWCVTEHSSNAHKQRSQR